MNTCKHVLLRSILTLSFFLLLLASCQQQEETAEISGTPVDVSLQITVEGIREYASGMDDASSVETRATPVTGPLKPGVRFLVLALQRNQIKDRALYEVKADGSGVVLVDASKPMKLSPGSYKFVAYSLNAATDPPALDGDGVLSVNDKMDGLLLGDDKEEFRIVGNEPVPLMLTFTPMFSKVQVKIDAAGLGANVVLPGEVKLQGTFYSKASLSLLGGSLFNYTDGKDASFDLTFSDVPGVTRASNAIYVLPTPVAPKVTVQNVKVQGYSPFTGEGTLCPLLPGKEYVYTHLLRGTPLSGANCFIIYEPGSYAIDATIKGNGKQVELPTGYSSSDATTVPEDRVTIITGGVSAKVLWETVNVVKAPPIGSVVKDVTYDSLTKEIKFTTTATEGNALIAVYNAAGKVLWSWHIWRTNEGPAEMPLDAITGFTTNGELVLMDRNLGALNSNENHLSTGLHYQWGRKDPMPGLAQLFQQDPMGTAGGVLTLLPGKKSVDEAIQNPTAFITAVNHPADAEWCPRNNNLWGAPVANSKGSKTIYDPCPPGWRIPPAYTYNNIQARNCNIIYEGGFSLGHQVFGFTPGSAWFPNSGSRQASGIFEAGTNKIWTASPTAPPNEYGASNYYYTSVTMNPDPDYKTLGRAYGSSCRCMKE